MRSASSRSGQVSAVDAAFSHIQIRPMSSTTFGGQSSIPTLPLPKLTDTCDRYLQVVQPFLTKQEFARTKRAVAEFCRPNGVGVTLQQRLEALKKAKDSERKESWLSAIWLRMAYLHWRDPSFLLSNWSLSTDDLPASAILIDTENGVTRVPHVIEDIPLQLARAALFISEALQWRRRLREQTMPQEVLGRERTPLCMDQFRCVFSTCRVPGLECDELRTVDDATHVLVICNDRYYEVPVYERTAPGADLRELDAEQIAASLLRVHRSAHAGDSGTPMGVLTADRRDEWAKARADLLEHSEANRRAIDSIETSLFSVTLSPLLPRGGTEQIKATAHDVDGGDRWWDKSISAVFFANARCGINGEHSPNDTPQPAQMVDHCLGEERTERGLALLAALRRFVADGAPLRVPAPRVAELVWETPPSVRVAIRAARRRTRELIARFDFKLQVSHGVGKTALRALGIPPDSFFQLALNVAHRRLHPLTLHSQTPPRANSTIGRPPPTYESASMRRFLCGRTETIRSVSMASERFAETFTGATKAYGDDRQTLQRLFDEAMTAHVNYAKAATAGNGVDRHLLGLRCMLAADEALPSIFADPAYFLTLDFILSTSNVSMGKHWFGSFAAVTKHGYGIPYSIRDDSILYGVATWKDSAVSYRAEQYADCVHRTVFDLYTLMSSNSSKSKL